MKKLLLLLIGASILLSACGGDSDTTTVTDSDEPYFYEYVTAEFIIDAPDTWEVITAFTSEYPEELRVAFRNNVKDSDFIANVGVIREENEASWTNTDYAQKKLSDHAETLVSYKLLSQEELSLLIGGAQSSTFLNTFEGKNEASGPTLNFQQVYLVKGDKAYTVTASYLPTEDEFVVERMETMLKSFTLK